MAERDCEGPLIQLHNQSVSSARSRFEDECVPHTECAEAASLFTARLPQSEPLGTREAAAEVTGAAAAIRYHKLSLNLCSVLCIHITGRDCDSKFNIDRDQVI